MICKQFQPIFDAMIDGSVTEQQRKQLESHIQTCPDCRQNFQTHCTMEMVVGECFTLPGPSDQITQSILNRIANQNPPLRPLPDGQLEPSRKSPPGFCYWPPSDWVLPPGDIRRWLLRSTRSQPATRFSPSKERCWSVIRAQRPGCRWQPTQRCMSATNWCRPRKPKRLSRWAITRRLRCLKTACWF